MRVAPVDPIDPFRGAYVTLDYPDLSRDDSFSADGGLGALEDGESGPVYVSLSEHDGLMQATEFSRSRPGERELSGVRRPELADPVRDRELVRLRVRGEEDRARARRGRRDRRGSDRLPRQRGPGRPRDPLIAGMDTSRSWPAEFSHPVDAPGERSLGGVNHGRSRRGLPMFEQLHDPPRGGPNKTRRDPHRKRRSPVLTDGVEGFSRRLLLRAGAVGSAGVALTAAGAFGKPFLAQKGLLDGRRRVRGHVDRAR